jgi:hypothetical protein
MTIPCSLYPSATRVRRLWLDSVVKDMNLSINSFFCPLHYLRECLANLLLSFTTAHPWEVSYGALIQKGANTKSFEPLSIVCISLYMLFNITQIRCVGIFCLDCSRSTNSLQSIIGTMIFQPNPR